MTAASSNEGLTPIGQEWLRRELGLEVPASAVESYIVQGARRTADHGSRILEFYPRSYATDPTPVSNVRFALRHETDRFVAALKAAPGFKANKESLVRMQGDIVDPRYAAKDWRDFQNFVGETVRGYREEVHFIGPRPQDRLV
jgi:hypothetical protein